MRVLVAALLVLGGVAEDIPGHKPFAHQVNIPIRDVNTHQIAALFKAKLAIKDDEQHTGLMFIQSLPKDEGMIFLSEKPSKRVLYMKDTHVPLSVGWFNQEGVLKEVQDLVPLDLTWRWSKDDDISFGLEMNKGWFAKHFLKPDHVQIDMKLFNKAIADRGFDPTVYFPQVRKEQHSPAEFHSLIENLQKPKQRAQRPKANPAKGTPVQNTFDAKRSAVAGGRQVAKAVRDAAAAAAKAMPKQPHAKGQRGGHSMAQVDVEAQRNAELEEVQVKLEAQVKAEHAHELQLEYQAKVDAEKQLRERESELVKEQAKEALAHRPKVHYATGTRLIGTSKSNNLIKKIQPQGNGKHYYKPMAAVDLMMMGKSETLKENQERKRKAELVAQYSYDELLKAMVK